MNATPFPTEFAHSGLMTAPGKAVIPPDWDRLMKKLGQLLGDVVALAGTPAVLMPGAPRALPLVEWLAELPPVCAVARFEIAAFKGIIFLSISPPMIGALVDRFYGGRGAAPTNPPGLTIGERKFLGRLVGQIGDTMARAFPEGLRAEPRLLDLQTDAAEVTGGREDEEVVVQGFAIDRHSIELVFPLSAMRAFASARPTHESAVLPSSATWQADLATAAMEIHFPVRTLIASPTISAERLLALAPGDVLELILPPLVPMTVAGRLLAKGVIGEANGRAALQISRMEGEVPDHSGP